MTARNLIQSTRRLVDRRQREYAEETARELRRIVPVDTGALRDSIRVEGDTVIIDVPYAEDVNDGTATRQGEFFVERATSQAISRVSRRR